MPDGLSLQHAALAEPLAVALHGITRAGGARPGTRCSSRAAADRALSVAALVAMGVTDVVVSEPTGSGGAICAIASVRAR